MFDPRTQRWNGALPVPRSERSSTPGVATCELSMPATVAAPLYSWIRDVQPAEQQQGPCCAGMAWANWLEAMLRRWAPRTVPMGRWQLDGERVWRRGRELFWKGELDGGLYVSQGFAALLSLGWLPPAAQLRRIPVDWASIGFALLDSPLVQAHQVHAGWYRPDPQNGCIDHKPEPAEDDGFHCTLLIGRSVQFQHGVTTHFYQSMNSWGDSWGWNGLFVMTELEWIEGSIPDGLYTADVHGLAEWQGWRDGVRML
jgi:hypothetical protein